MASNMYISLTGLKPKGFFAYLRFWLLAIPSFRQAQIAEGNLHCDVKKVNEYQCTITAWESREIMLKYLRSGAHLKAMKAFKQIATGPTYGYESETIPSWEEAYALLMEKGKMH
jgi:hypothetical protein